MFENLINKSTKPSSSGTARKGGAELTRTIQFLRALVGVEHRISYGALAVAAEMLGEHTPSGLSAGQRGATIVGKLPVELQPHVCRSDGGYQKGQAWDTEVPGNLRNRAYVRPEAVATFVQAFVAATAPKAASPAPAPEEVEEVDPETGEPQED